MVRIISGLEKRMNFYTDVQLDTTRDTAILIRQSGRGANIKHYESRLLQESLIPFVMQKRKESDLTHTRIYDEGAGVSGRKGIDKRSILRQLHYDIADGLVGDIVLARADRLFRDKHFDKVSTFTILAEKMGIRVIVPASQGVIVYDFRVTKDLQTFQQDMQVAYNYIENQIGYMNRARNAKKARGLYGGGFLPLPLVLLRDGEKDDQKPVVYPEWQSCTVDLFTKFRDFGYELPRFYRYVEGLPCIFPFMSGEDMELYIPLTNLSKVASGYTFTSPHRLRSYMKNLALAGYAPGGRDENGDTFYIEGAWEAAISRELFEPAYASIEGEYIDGTPDATTNRPRQFRRNTYETDAILHGLVTSDNGTVNVFAQIEDEYPIYACFKGGYFGQSSRVGLNKQLKAWTLPCSEIDRIILERLIALVEYDPTWIERLKVYFAEAGKQGESKLSVLDIAIQKTQIALKRLSKAIVLLSEGNEDEELDPDDPIVKEHRKLSSTLRSLLKQRQEAAIETQEDPAKNIENFYHVLAHLRSEFTNKPPQTKKDIIKKLVSEVKIHVIAPHLYTLHITWVQPMAADRDDVALIWRSDPTRTEITTEWMKEEEDAVRELYPTSEQIVLMQRIPNKTPGQIRKKARELKVAWRKIGIERHFWWTITYTDLEVAAQFTTTQEQKELLWQEINRMAENTRRGKLTESWFLPIDMLSFSHVLEDTAVNDDGLSILSCTNCSANGYQKRRPSS